MKDIKKGKLVIICGPSGVGKGTLSKEIIKDPKYNFIFSVSHTTRKKRKGEKNKKEYFFVSKKKFSRLIEKNKMLEFTEYNNNYYGTSFSFVNKNINKGKNVFLEIESIGVKNIVKKIPSALTIFIFPPHFSILEKRLNKRGTENKEAINKRLEIAKLEIKKGKTDLFKYKIVNDNLKIAQKQLKELFDKELC